MFIKVAVVGEARYMRRIIGRLNQTYRDSIQIECFTEFEKLEKEMQNTYFHIVLADESKEVDPSWFTEQNVEFAWLTNDKVSRFRDEDAVAKYQSQEELYRSILGLSAKLVGSANENRKYQFITFCGSSGGSGSTSVALAYAKRMSDQGKKVFYFNLEHLNSFSAYVNGNKEKGMDEALYRYQSDADADKGKALESIVAKDLSGKYYFFGECENPYDMQDTNESTILEMIDDLVKAGKYTHVVMDVNFDFSKRIWKVLEKSNVIAIVSRTNESGQRKTERFLKTIQQYDAMNQTGIYNHVKVIYNQCLECDCDKLVSLYVPKIAELPVFNGNEKQVVEAMSMRTELENL